MQAGSDSIGGAPLRRRDEGIAWCFIGSRAQLISAGVIAGDTPLPRDPGQRRTWVRYAPGHPLRLVCAWPVQNGRYGVRVAKPDAVVRELERAQAQRDAVQESARQVGEAEREIEAWPRSFEAFRESREFALRLLDYAVRALTQPEGGYRVEPEAVDTIGCHAQEIRLAFKSATLHFSAAERDAQASARRSKVVLADADFGAFMQRLVCGENGAGSRA